MGSIVAKLKKNKTVHDARSSKNPNKENIMEIMNEVDYDKDVMEAANLAIAIQKEDFTTNIELSLSCENLPRMDTFSQSDPMVVVLIDKEDNWVELGRTEVIPETIFPKFMKTFVVSYNFEKQQKLRFDVYDIDYFQDVMDKNLDKQDYIGYVETDLHEIVCSPTQSIYKTILNPHNKRRKNGTLIVKGSEFDINSSKYVFRFSVRNIASKAELFLRVFTLNENQEFIPVTSTDVTKNTKKSCYEWSPLFIASAKILSESDLIRFELCEFNKSKGILLLGDCEVVLEKLLKKELLFLNIFKNNSILCQLHLEVNKFVRLTFLNYIYAGTEISLIVGIDFSKSNKDSYDPDSLHRIGEAEDNDYVHALKSIVGILQYYDHDNHIPVYGFGAKLPPSHKTVSQCFALNGNFFNPEVCGIEEVLKVYHETVKNAKFHGPQIFNEIVKMAGMYASSEEVTNLNQKYYILLLVTNGFISDFEFTRNTIKELSVLPLSIVIVGLGDGIGKNKDGVETNFFDLLQKLMNIPGSRDIVQFVKFNDVKQEIEKIAKATLASVPKQFLKFMEIHKIEPLITNDNVLKTSTRDYKQMKIEDLKSKMKSQNKLPHDDAPSFLLELKDQISKKLKFEFHYDSILVDFLLNEKGVSANDFNLIYELISEEKTLLKTLTRNKTLPTSIEIESKEKELKKQLFMNGPHVKHRFFRSRNGRNYNFYDKIKKKSENLDETKRILDMNYKRIYDSPIYERKQVIKEEKSIDSSEERSLPEHKSSFQTPQKKSGNPQNPPDPDKEKKVIDLTLEKPQESAEKKKKKPKTKVLGGKNTEKHRKNVLNKEDELFYDPLQGRLDTNLCMACQNAKIEILNLPCGHSCCCQNCFMIGNETCLFCNSVVKNYVLINMGNKSAAGGS